MSDELKPVWKALADPTRRTILDLLRERPHTTGELSDAFDVSRYAVMKHLNVLVEAGLVTVRREGRERWNHLNAIPLQMVVERWIRPYEGEWAQSLVNLRRRAEQDTGEGLPMTQDFSQLHIEQELTIAAPPEQVFRVLTQDFGSWYGEPYVSAPTRMECFVGGRVYEDFGEGQGMLLATVIDYKPPGHLRLMGPMNIPGPVQGDIVFTLEEVAEGTRLLLSHRAIGKLASNIEERYIIGWDDLLNTRLRALIEEPT